MSSALLAAFAVLAQSTQPTQPNLSIRINQIGYLPDAPKTAVVCALEPEALMLAHAR